MKNTTQQPLGRKWTGPINKRGKFHSPFFIMCKANSRYRLSYLLTPFVLDFISCFCFELFCWFRSFTSQTTTFQLCWDDFLSSRLEPVLSSAQRHNTVAQPAASLELATLRPQFNALPTDSLRSDSSMVLYVSYLFYLLNIKKTHVV